ncbi:MAG: hypothetical protein AB8B58_11485 [Roseobacter sp.]
MAEKTPPAHLVFTALQPGARAGREIASIINLIESPFFSSGFEAGPFRACMLENVLWIGGQNSPTHDETLAEIVSFKGAELAAPILALPLIQAFEKRFPEGHV